MVEKRVEFDGFSGTAGRVPAVAQIAVDSTAECVYVEVVRGVIQVWSGPACKECQRVDRELLRCPLHERVMLVADQYSLFEGDRGESQVD